MNKQLITPANKRAAIIEKLAKASFLISWIIINYIIYIKFKQNHTKNIKFMEEILKLSASNEQLIRILVTMKDRIESLENKILKIETNGY